MNVCDISYTTGNQNIIVDCLSQPANAFAIDVCDLQEMVKHQATDEEIKHFHEQLKPYPINRQTIQYNISLPFP